MSSHYLTLDQLIGNTPLVRLQRMQAELLAERNNIVLAKLEGNNPAGSVKDRAALSMIIEAERRGEITPGDTLIEATSGNTGIALAMVAALRGYKMILIMPDNLSIERRGSMTVYGAQLILTETAQGHGMEYARDLALQMQAQGLGKVLNQFGNTDNPLAHIRGTGPEIWRDTHGQITHFVSAMGTTGTITGTSTFLKAQNPEIQIIGVQPSEGSSIPGIRKWPTEYLPTIFEPARVDREIAVTQVDAEETARRLAREEGIFAGISSGGALWAALQLAQEVRDATIVFIVCDRGDRYLSQGVFNPPN
ncbi:MAG: cysteine synthase CysM [Burkholderiaceae bacterium]